MGDWGTNERVKNELEARKRCITEKEAKKDKVHRPVHCATEALMAVEGLKCPYCQASHFPDKCDKHSYRRKYRD